MINAASAESVSLRHRSSNIKLPTRQHLRSEVDDSKNKAHRLPTFKLVTETVISVRSLANELVGAKEQLLLCDLGHGSLVTVKTVLRLKLAFHTSYTGAGRSRGVVVTSQTCYHGDKVLPAAVGSRPSLGAMVTGW